MRGTTDDSSCNERRRKGPKSGYRKRKLRAGTYVDKLLKHDDNLERRVAYVGFS